ncbi:helix-turn-helix transcriptional regulator [Comamonas serinivorans]|uniref:Helix-turn-helix transcriptional regulator n=1 Tax=Comamonas serinivorans TaxID=1082851 RepID=A0A1Y0ENN4_9BURK|nr:LuxR C-terminal-related transcriptional regulator [Comamonas serinivorans]ARU05245.1 helix-turn-helix transcriptional regulator [Comamonas serinivorans]
MPTDAVPRPGAPALSHKLHPPVARTGQVVRAALQQRIARAQGQLVLVTAPAGFGKTTALLQAHDHLKRQGLPCLWLTLDTADNDTSRFLAGLQAALQLAGLAGSGDAIRSLLEQAQPFALFLDEVEVLTEPAVLSLVRELAERLPPQAHLVIGARGVPPIGLGRLRVKGKLTEVDAEQLRFGLPETRQLFDQLGAPPGLEAAHLCRLHAKTEGWVAALWLAHQALARAADPLEFVERFSGSNRAVTEYLAQDVLAQLPRPLKQFLLRTSLLKQLNASVCDALNPCANSLELLEQLDEQQLFLTPVDADARSWRYHSLFGDFLRNQLARECPDDVARLHLAASGWYHAQGRPVPAIDHAIEGGDLTLALTLIAEHAETFLEQGRMRLLARWFTAIPDEMLRIYPRLEMVAIWALCLTRGPWDAMARLDASLASTTDAGLRAHAKGMRPMFLAMQDRYDEALAAGQQALPGLPSGEPFADATLLNAMAHVTSVFFPESQVHPLLEASRQQQGLRSNFNRMYSEAVLGILDLMQGHLQQATERFRLSLDTTHAVTQQHAHGNAWAGVLYAHALYEANQLDQAEHLLNIYLPLARDVGLPDHMILSHIMRSRLAQWRGDIDAATQCLADLETLGHTRHMRRVVAAAQLERAHLALTREQAAQSAAQLRHAEDEALWARERRQSLIANETQYLQLSRIRWQLAFGDSAQLDAAAQALEAEMAWAIQGGRQRRLLVLKLLRAAALDRLGRWPEAQALLLKALLPIAQEGYVRLVVDEGPVVARTVRRLHQLVERDAQLQQTVHPQVLAHLAKLVTAMRTLGALEPPELAPPRTATTDPLAAPPAPTEGAAPDGMEPLTKRERQVLQLLALGYSNSAMAEKLYLSDSTVRTHLRSINAKLGARSRTHAVALARQASLVQG